MDSKSGEEREPLPFIQEERGGISPARLQPMAGKRQKDDGELSLQPGAEEPVGKTSPEHQKRQRNGVPLCLLNYLATASQDAPAFHHVNNAGL